MELKTFSTYIVSVSGRFLYTTYVDRVLMSITTILRFLFNTQSTVIEGNRPYFSISRQ